MSQGASQFRLVLGLAGVLVMIFGGVLSSAAIGGDLPRTAAPAGAALYLISPHPGEVVSSPVTVRFGLQGMGVAPAGVVNPKAGHHHLIIDAELPDLGLPVPSDANHRHFGGGQTEVTLELSSGVHTLQLVLGDHLHVPFDPPIVSDRISIQVK